MVDKLKNSKLQNIMTTQLEDLIEGSMLYPRTIFGSDLKTQDPKRFKNPATIYSVQIDFDHQSHPVNRITLEG